MQASREIDVEKLWKKDERGRRDTKSIGYG